MIILRPDWVTHTDDKKKNATIFTLHLHPNGKKLATGSLGIFKLIIYKIYEQ